MGFFRQKENYSKKTERCYKKFRIKKSDTEAETPILGPPDEKNFQKKFRIKKSDTEAETPILGPPDEKN